MKESTPLPNENLHVLSEEKRALREVLQDTDAIPAIQRGAQEGMTEISTSLAGLIEREGGITSVKERLRHDREASEITTTGGVDREAVLHSLDEGADAYQAIATMSKDADDLRDYTMQKMRETRGDPVALRANERLLNTATKEQSRLATELATLETEHPRAARALELIRNKEGLAQEGHIAPTASVETNLDRIGRNMLLGKPMFLHGPTGTGKTSLGRFAAKHFTGKSPEMVYCSPQTRESAIWAKTGIRLEQGQPVTVEIYGPMAKAAQEGKVVLFDEFTALPKEQMVFVKGVMNAKPGDVINIPGNGQITIAEGFQMICTANLKSEKNPERQELPPEIAREFEQNNIKIDYQPKDESYDIMLARLMNPDGSIDTSWKTLNETLPRLCEAMEEIQTAYTGTLPKDAAKLAGVMDASGKTQGLKKFVMTQGTIEAMFEDWKVSQQLGEETSFRDHIDERLKIGLTFEEYPLADRILAAKIFASKGFLRTLSPEALGLPGNVFDASAIKTLRAQKENGDEALIRIPLNELADCDPFGKRKTTASAKAEQFLGASVDTETIEGEPLTPEDIKQKHEAFLKTTFEKWYDPTKAQVEQVPIIIDPKEQNFATLAKDVDATKFGEYTVNPDMQGVNFESIVPEKIKVLAFEEFVGKPLHELAQHIVDTYSDTHHIPGIEFWQWMIEEYDNAPDDVKEKYKELKDGNYHFCFGSLVRSSDGFWRVPYADRAGSEWSRNADWLVASWGADCRVVLLEK